MIHLTSEMQFLSGLVALVLVGSVTGCGGDNGSNTDDRRPTSFAVRLVVGGVPVQAVRPGRCLVEWPEAMEACPLRRFPRFDLPATFTRSTPIRLVFRPLGRYDMGLRRVIGGLDRPIGRWNKSEQCADSDCLSSAVFNPAELPAGRLPNRANTLRVVFYGEHNEGVDIALPD